MKTGEKGTNWGHLDCSPLSIQPYPGKDWRTKTGKVTHVVNTVRTEAAEKEGLGVSTAWSQ